MLAIKTSGVGIKLVDAHIAVADVDFVLVLVDEHGERILAGSVSHVVENGHAIEDAIGVVDIEQFTITQGLIGILISESLTSHGNIDAVLVALQRQGMFAGVEVGVDDVTVLILIHEVTTRGREVQTCGAS